MLGLLPFVVGILLTVRRRTRLGVTLIVGALAIIPLGILIEAFVFKPYRVPSESMVPTVKIGDRVLVSRTSSVGVGDIVIFHPPAPANGEVGGLGPSGQCGVDYAGGQSCPREVGHQSEVSFIKRVVAGPGDTVALRHGQVILNGKLQREPFVTPCQSGDECDFPTPVTVPPGHWFTLGDNRGASDDSRFWGPVPDDWVVGVVVARTLPLGDMTTF